MEEARISIATTDHREEVLRTITTAFAADPFLRLMFPDDDEYATHAPAFFGALFDKRAGSGTVWMLNDGEAVAMWDGPGVTAEAKFELPAAAKAVMDAYDESVHGAFPATRHWYLGVLATDPQHAGRGLGRAVMRAGLARAAADGLPAYLETTNPANVELYQRGGWSIDAQFDAPLPIWVMRQDPAT
jgi:ribosomal protein S18 acetylase RimI-like enzyme